MISGDLSFFRSRVLGGHLSWFTNEIQFYPLG